MARNAGSAKQKIIEFDSMMQLTFKKAQIIALWIDKIGFDAFGF
jgi:hypothetical protein